MVDSKTCRPDRRVGTRNGLDRVSHGGLSTYRTEEESSGTRAEINLDNFKHNLQTLWEMIGPEVNTDVPNVQLKDEVIMFSHEHDAMNYYEAAQLTFFNRNGLQSALPRHVPKVYFGNGVVIAARDYLMDKE